MDRRLHAVSKVLLFLGLFVVWAEPSQATDDVESSPGEPNTVIIVEGQADENGTLTMSAPEGVFTEVIFASYGTPENFTHGWCHADSSASQVAAVFLGNESGTIAATNNVFGDPCGGTYKRLQVRLAYRPTVATTTTQPEPTTTITEPPTSTEQPADTEPEESSSPPTEVSTTIANTAAPTSAPSPIPSPEPLPPPTQPSPSSSSPSETTPDTTPPATDSTAPESTVGTTAAPTTAPVTTAPVTAPVPTPEPPQPETPTGTSSLVETTMVETTTTLPASTDPTAPPQNASDDEKEAFESQVNIFGGAFDSYVPAGSTITVAQRRTVVAVTAVLFAMPLPTTPGGRRNHK